MNQHLTFVLGGGGARGALQVGALRALFEAGFKPDLLVGTSIGAVNAAGLALRGVNLAGVEALERAYEEMVVQNLMDPRIARLTLRVLSGLPNYHASQRVSEFLIAKGIRPELRFDQITNVRLALIGADLASGQPVIYGQDPSQSVLEGLLASMALPPWFMPIEKDSQCIVDGGALSNLPIEPALTMGAIEIIALDLNDSGMLGESNHMFSQYLSKFIAALNHRHVYLETALAEARGVSVRRIGLQSPTLTPIWDFSDSKRLIQIGYEITARTISEWGKLSSGEFVPLDLAVENRPEFS